MIDEDTERAVESWVRLGDEVARRSSDEEGAACARCGSHDHVLGDEADALCARCYLERGPLAA